MPGITLPEALMISAATIVWAALVGIPAALICRRLGWPWYLGILATIPLANLALLWFVALATSPRERGALADGAPR